MTLQCRNDKAVVTSFTRIQVTLTNTRILSIKTLIIIIKLSESVTEGFCSFVLGLLQYIFVHTLIMTSFSRIHSFQFWSDVTPSIFKCSTYLLAGSFEAAWPFILEA